MRVYFFNLNSKTLFTSRSQMIYHYCTPATFLNIVKSRSIWACDLTKMNDPAELQHGFTVIKEVWDEEFPTQKAKLNIDNLTHERLFHLATSFSENGDLLSQWRAYGCDGFGFAIGIDETDLKKANIQIEEIHFQGQDEITYRELGPMFKLRKVFYCTNEYRSYIQGKIRKFKEENGVPFEKKEGEPLKLSHIYFTGQVIEDACLLKSNFYQEEKESRLFTSLQYHTIEPLHKFPIKKQMLTLDFMPTSHGLKAFTPIELIGNGVSAIKEVVIGPKSNTTTEEVKLFLSINSFSDCIVRRSEGEYR